ncbi:MAG: hypothetical protein R3A80_06090 [Bdellovibrionota bacterium]
MRNFVLLLFLGALVACQPIDTTQESSDSNSKKSTQALMQDLKVLSSGACSSSSDCYSAGVGARSCGGPEDYLVFSRWDSASSIFETLYSYNEARKKEVSGSVGTCEYKAPPSLSCVQNKCKAQNSTDSGNSRLLTIVPGVLSLAPKNIADAAEYTFRAQNNSTTYYIRTAQLDFSTRSRLDAYRKDEQTVQLNVRIFGLMIEATACEFIYASCSTRVQAFDLRAIKVL